MIINFNMTTVVQMNVGNWYVSGRARARDSIGETPCATRCKNMQAKQKYKPKKKHKPYISRTKLKYAINFLSIVYIFHRHHHHYLIINVAVDARCATTLSNALWLSSAISEPEIGKETLKLMLTRWREKKILANDSRDAWNNILFHRNIYII